MPHSITPQRSTPRSGNSLPAAALLSLLILSLIGGCGDAGGEDGDAKMDTQVVVVDDTPVGLACTDETADVCGSGICATLLPGGYCTSICDPSTPCPDGSVCTALDDFSFCMRSCNEHDQCRRSEGYVCQNNVCDIGCTSSSQCANTEVCEEGLCIEKPADRLLNAPCDRSNSCVDGYCLSESFGSLCAEACGAGDSCTREDWGCADASTIETPETMQQLCIPGGGQAIQGAGVLTPDPDDPSYYEFLIEPGVASFLIVASGAGSSGLMVSQNLESPTGLYAGELDFTGFTSPFRMSPNAGHASILVPNSDDPSLQIQPGIWRVQIIGETFTERVQLFTKSGGNITNATVDLNVFLPEGVLSGINASNATESSHLQTALERMRTNFWQEHGLIMGAVNYFNIPGGYNSINSQDELHEMFDVQSGSTVEGALNLFFVRELSFPEGEAAGIAGGIPGPVGVNGTGGSGVAIAIQDTAAATGDDATHELGHFLGLYHVTEFGGNVHDVFEETPRCQNDPFFTWNDPCQENIMFPTLLTGFIARQYFSPEQGRVLRLQPQAR